jgi:hypothetical protein
VSGPASADGDKIVIYDFSFVEYYDSMFPVRCPEVRFFADVDQPRLGVKHAMRGSRMFNKKMPERARVIAFRRRRFHMAAVGSLGQCMNRQWMFQS